MRRATLLGAAAAGLVLIGILLDPRVDQGHAPKQAAPTPLTELARNVQWIRFQRALLRGEEEQAIRLAESAVTLDPGSTEGWELLASHLAVFRGSPEREHDLARRRAWFRAGTETARSGEATARDPVRLAIWRGMLYLDRARLDPELDPGGPRALLAEARRIFDEARARTDAPPSARAELEALEAYAREQLALLPPD